MTTAAPEAVASAIATSEITVSLADSVAWGEDAFGSAREASEVHRGLGELVAKKPGEANERRGAVTLTSHAVRVRIAGAVARTEVEEVFTNQTDQVLEGIFRFPLPPDAQIELVSPRAFKTVRARLFDARDRLVPSKDDVSIGRGTTLRIAPQEPLEPGNSYRIVIDDALEGMPRDIENTAYEPRTIRFTIAAPANGSAGAGAGGAAQKP